MAYIGNGRTLLVLGSNVRDDIVPDNSTTTFTLSQEVPGGYEGNVYVFKQTYITERLITDVVGNNATTGITFGTSGSNFTITTSNAAIAAALSDIKETTKLYADANHTITISGSGIASPNSNNGTFAIISCTYSGSTLTITLAKTANQGTPDTGSITLNRGYSGYWEVLEPETDYTIGGTGTNLNRQITFSKVPKLDDKVYVVHKGDATYNLVPSDNSVGPNQLSQNLRNFTIDKFTGNNSTVNFTLSQSVVNDKSILVTVNGVVKEDTTDYTVAADGTTLTFTTAPANAAKIRVLHLGFSTVSRRAALSPGQSGPVAPLSITASELATSSVVDSKIATSAVTNTKLASDSISADKILLANNTSLRSYRVDGTTVFSALTLNSSDELILNTPTTAHISVSGTKTVNVSSTQIAPETTAAIALGSATKKFTDAHLSGQLNSATANVTGNITVGGTVDGVDVSVLSATVSSLQTLVNNLVPIGTMMIWPTDTLPSANWLLCDGTAVSRTTYADLFTAVGTTYGSGNGTTTFNIPDMRRRVPVGKGTTTSVGNNDALAETARSLTHTHTVPAHTHGMSSHTHSLPAHYHGMGTGATLNVTSSGSHTTTIDISHGHTVNSSTGVTGGSGTLTTNRSTTGVSLTQTAHNHGGATVSANPAHAHTMQSAGDHKHTLRQEASGSGSSNTININSTSLGLNTTSANMGTEGAHTHTINSQNIDHAHGIYGDTANLTWTEPNAGTGHDHTINSHSHSVIVDALGTTNKTDNGGSHTHSSASFSGLIGLVTGGVNGNAAMTSDAPSTNTTENSSVLTSGTTINMPYTVINYVIRAA